MQPRIVRAVYDQQGTLLRRYAPRVVRRVFSQRTASELRSFLRAVVLHGTGDPTAQIPGYATAGKTGTAEMVVDGRYRSGYYAASFIGMVPYPRARYVIYVKVERPDRGVLRKRRRGAGVRGDRARCDAARRSLAERFRRAYMGGDRSVALTTLLSADCLDRD